jgi:hypothetical protein
MKDIFILSVFILSGLIAKSQGCSDAGLCTIHSFKPSGGKSDSSVSKNQFRIGISGGSADYDILVSGVLLEYSRQINRSFSVDSKIGLLSQSGNKINTAGFSDLFFNINYNTSKKIKLILGVKIPLSDANKQKNGLALPMDYQSSLGTVDLIVGVGYTLEKWKFNFGWQQPITQNNNTFLAENYPATSALSKFQSTNNYHRNGDILLRVSYTVKLSEKWTLTPGILPIYHLSNDEFTNINGKQIIHGSSGLTLNANAYLNYTLNKKNALEFNLGSPLVVRDSRPDGLTRSFVAAIQYQLSF